MTNEPLFAKYLRIFGVVAAYWIISILTVFVNKALLSSEILQLDAPLFVTFYQCVVSSVICFTWSNISDFLPQKFYFPKGSPLQREIFVKVFPLSVLFTAMIAFNNLCLKYVDVSFYYIGRSLTTVFNVVLSYLILGQRTSCSAILCCAVIVGGFWLGVDQENVTGSLSVLGTCYGVLGSLSLSLYSIYTKRILPFVNQEICLLSYYNNVYSCLIFIPIIIVKGEVSTVLSYDKLFTLMFWLLMTIGGLCGLAIGFVTACQIKVTSPLTHNISGTAKACAQTVIASYWYSESKPMLWWCSNWIVLGGSGAYARVKQLEMEREHKQQIAEKEDPLLPSKSMV